MTEKCRGWGCIHRHLNFTILSALFRARVCQKLSPPAKVLSGELLTLEPNRRAVNVYLDALDLPPKEGRKRHQQELDRRITRHATIQSPKLALSKLESQSHSSF